MAQDPAPGAGQDGAVTPDWLDDAGWDRIGASRAWADEPEGFIEEWDAWAPGEEDGPPADWVTVDLRKVAVQAQADGTGHAAVMRRLIAAGVGEGYAHQAGAPPVPGTFTGPAAGFGQGHCLDAAVPCTGLSQLADEASGEDRGFKDVTDDQLLGMLSARARLEARQAWERLMAVAEFIRRRPEAGCPLQGPGRMPRVWQESAAEELRAQLHLSPKEASALLDLAHDLTVKLPRTAAALRDGVIDLGRARLIAWRCAVLTAAECRIVEELLFGDPELADWTFGMFGDRVARAVIQANPGAAARRREESARERRVEVRAEPSGNAALMGRELPPAAVLAASRALTARARELRRAGVAGGMDELRVQAYLQMLGVHHPPMNTTDPAPGGEGRGPDVPPGGLASAVNLTLPLTTLLGLAERPGTMPLIGPIDPALVRDLAAAAARHPASTWCVTVTDAQGRPVAHGCGRPPPRRPRDDHGPPGEGGTIRLTPAAFAGAKAAGQDTSTGQDLVFALEPLAGPCDHRHQARGHEPGKLLRHLTGILNAQCTFPPCRRPESRSDYEHSVPFGQGGKTCLCQAGPVCRHDHRAKQSPGWHLEQAGARGWFRWTAPSGRTYLSRPTRYPD